MSAQPSAAPGTHARHSLVGSLRLGFIVALERLAPEQRAVLLLCDVLGYDGAETAAMLAVTEARVAALLAAGRAAFGTPSPAPADAARERLLVARFGAAFGAGDDARGTLAPAVVLARPPAAPLHGRAAVAAWLGAHRPAAFTRGRAGGQPAFGCRTPDGVLVLDTAGDAIAELTWFADAGLAARLGLARR